MSPRELVILLLGLAIVAVVLRGLYVAIQARRGQIRLAIDKNIPKDVDLDALEMAELPSGGARVVHRGNPDAERVARASNRASALDLDDDDVPVLMDAVQINSARPAPELPEQDFDDQDLSDDELDDDYDEQQGFAASSQSEQADDDEAELQAELTDEVAEQGVELVDDDDDAYDAGYETQGYETGHGDDHEDDLPRDEDPDAVLMDYGDDSLGSVAPDYRDADDSDHAEDDADWDEEADNIPEPTQTVEDDYEDYEDEAIDEPVDGLNELAEDTGEAGSDYDAAYDGDADSDSDEDEQRSEPGLGNLDDELDEFSMTAGERIGYEGKSRPAPARQTSLFDDEDEELPEPREAKPGLKSLFSSAFNRKKPEPAAAPHTEQPQPAAEVKAAPEPETPRVEAVPEEAPVTMMRPQPEPEPAPSPEPAPTSQSGSDSNYVGEPSEVLVINIMARDGRAFRGDDLMHALITAGLKFGDMNIFHQRLGRDKHSPVIFSVANILNPGTFDLNAMDSFTTVGISFFLALPSPINNLDALEKMLASAEQIRLALDGELKDDSRNGMTAQTIEHYRQRVRDFELRQLKAAGGRG
ncbi:MAG: cell division protein ZipA [Pseudomonadales bacterium]|nr:cell division protein ZipA [Pseudomonadales bacterium]